MACCDIMNIYKFCIKILKICGVELIFIISWSASPRNLICGAEQNMTIKKERCCV